MATVNRQIRLAARPVGFPEVADFELVYAPLPAPAADEVLVQSNFLSLDPDLRLRMNDSESYGRPVAIGEVMVGGAVGHVLESEDARFETGDAVAGMLGWQEYAVESGNGLTKLDLGPAPISTALGVLGVPGLTAYFGLLDICGPNAGETVVVSGAAGAVGMLVGQVARIKGCRVVGVAGSDAEVSWLLDELGFDAAINYRNDDDFRAELEGCCPDGINIYFDVAGGAITDAVIQRLAVGARVALCGQISQDNLAEGELGPRWLGRLITQRARMQGFLVSSYTHRFPEGLMHLASWLAEGRIRYREDVAQGIEAAPQAFISMLQGRNQGNQLVQLSDQ